MSAVSDGRWPSKREEVAEPLRLLRSVSCAIVAIDRPPPLSSMAAISSTTPLLLPVVTVKALFANGRPVVMNRRHNEGQYQISIYFMYISFIYVLIVIWDETFN